MKLIPACFISIILSLSFVFVDTASSGEIKYMQDHPASYIKVHDYSVYATWSAVAILHNITIENTSDITYENIKVRIWYTSFDSPGNVISQEVGIIPVTIPPHSKQNYLRAGIPFGGASQSMSAVDIQVLGAEVAN